MQLAQSAMVARHDGDTERAVELARQAYDLERQAVNLVPERKGSEPTFSIMHGSAASLAYHSEQYDLAQRHIAQALSGYPSTELRRELKKLDRDIDFRLSLRDAGVVLKEDELQLSVEGTAVGVGTVLYSEFIARLENAHTQIERTVQRLMKKDYQRSGRIAERYRPFTVVLSAPTAGSFGVSIKLATPEEKEPILFPQASEIIDEVIKGIELVNAGQEDALRALIPEKGYYTSFLSVARDMAPDGERITAVRFASKSRAASLTRQPSEIVPMPEARPEEAEPKREPLALEGTLDYASSRRGQVIGLTTEEGRRYTIAVEEGMDDVVRAHYGRLVFVAGLYDFEEEHMLLEQIHGINE